MARESIELKAMRHMAWERAKGELRSMLVTYYDERPLPDHNYDAPSKFKRFDDALKAFIDLVEDQGLAE